MSHITKIKVEIKDLEVLKDAVEKLGLTFNENKNRYKWWGDYNSSQNKCDHVISLKDPNAYEIGVTKKGDKYELFWDAMDSRLTTAVGRNGEKLNNKYANCVISKETKEFARYNNYSWAEAYDKSTDEYTVTLTEY